MSKICPLCGGVAVWAGNNFLGEDVYECTICHEPGHYSRFKEDATVFHKITQSPEVLAEKLVYLECIDRMWHSTIFPYPEYPYPTRDEAIAATVAKLKEVAE